MEDGATLREHLESRWNQSGKRPPELDVGELPECMSYVWRWFCSMHQERQFTDMGQPKPLASGQIRDWAWLNDVALSAFELRAIRVLDGAYMAASPVGGKKGKGSD